MPDRIIRDELLGSPRYWQLSSDTARMLFIHLALRADDLGIFRAANYTIRQECFGVDHKPGPEAVAKMISELADSDLIRLYQHDRAEYGFIPRWKQRLRIIRPRFPLPPQTIRDKHFNELIDKMSVICPSPVGHLSAEVEVDVEVEGKGSESKSKAVPPKPVHNSTLTKPQTWTEAWIAKGQVLGIKANPGETTNQYCRRVAATVKGE